MRIAEQVGGALEAAHGAGVVHGDIRPGSVVIDDNGNAYLANFGMALGDAVASGCGGAEPTHAPQSRRSTHRRRRSRLRQTCTASASSLRRPSPADSIRWRTCAPPCHRRSRDVIDEATHPTPRSDPADRSMS